MGVKSLWSLLTPVGRPVLLETIENKSLAIDSSIWLYQFQATMRDKDGRALTNAHVLGFLRRICKLLFYGIRPVFVFDGGAPVLKRSTIIERKKKKKGASASHARIAEKLLAAQMRREALDHANPATPPRKEKERAPAVIDENTVYLEDLDPTHARTPAKAKDVTDTSPSSSSKTPKARFHDHDPYRLPPVLPPSTSSSTGAPDPRLATDEELRDFINEMRPSDLDLESPAFLALPMEAQYELVRDLRFRSRQPSHAAVLASTGNPDPLAFSRAQIRGVGERNRLTQTLLAAGGGGGHGAIRIVGERNREYVLLRSEGKEGGWVLGLRDTGTRERPIEVDVDDEGKEEGDEEIDAMDSRPSAEVTVMDPDLRAYRNERALSAVGGRAMQAKARGVPQYRLHDVESESGTLPVFGFDEEEGDEDPELAVAIQRSLEPRLNHEIEDDDMGMDGISIPGEFMNSEPPTRVPLFDFGGDDEDDLELALAIKHSLARPIQTPPRASTSTSALPTHTPRHRIEEDDDDDLYAGPPSRLETALAIAGTAPRRREAQASMFGTPGLLTSVPRGTAGGGIVGVVDQGADELTEFTPVASSSDEDVDMYEMPGPDSGMTPESSGVLSASAILQMNEDDDDDDDMEEVVVDAYVEPGSAHRSMRQGIPTVGHISFSTPTAEDDGLERLTNAAASPTSSSLNSPGLTPSNGSAISVASTPLEAEEEEDMEKVTPLRTTERPIISTPQSAKLASRNVAPAQRVDVVDSEGEDDYGDGEPLGDWSRSPSPVAGVSTSAPAGERDETWDAAQEMDIVGEEGEFARFVSQVKGRNVDTVRAEIDQEIKSLHQQRKTALRDSEDITQQMISQIMLMLRLFGIPYITAPMEAEAQCAELVSLGLVEGIITDDSDVFLFGGQRVFKNMFNQSKTVECFFLSDLARELGLDRGTLVRLAYLLGSDYVEGLPGVGPVVAMELLREFPGEDGLHKFKDWWVKVQSGKDRPEDNKSKFRKRFKKKFKDLYLHNDWPNPAVRDAYYHPTVDESEEAFKWGMPDLDALRGFLHEELGWGQSKVDDLLLPIIQKVAKRGQASALNKQSNLDNFFDASMGGGAFAPRKRQAYSSKRLQEVVSEFRKGKRNPSVGASSAPASSSSSPERDAGIDAEEGPTKKRRKTKGKGKARADATALTGNKAAGRGRGRGRGSSAASSGRKKAEVTEIEGGDGDEDDYVGDGGDTATMAFAPELRPRPKPRPAYKRKVNEEATSDAVE